MKIPNQMFVEMAWLILLSIFLFISGVFGLKEDCPKFISKLKENEDCDFQCQCVLPNALRCEIDGDANRDFDDFVNCTSSKLIDLINKGLNHKNISLLDLNMLGALEIEGQIKLPLSALAISSNRSAREISRNVYASPDFKDSLRNLNLNNNHLKKLPSALNSLMHLQVLDLCHNQITKLFLTNKSLNPTLESFDLSHNLVSEIIINTRMENLRTLRLGYNRLDMNSFNVFMMNMADNFSNLNELRINHNLIQGTLQILSFIPSLTYLDLSANGIVNISDNAFIGVTNLSFLTLRGNQLDTLNTYSFKHLRKLKTLDLSNNKLVVFRHHPKVLPSIRTLNLSHNHIQEFNKNFGIKTLETLDLSDNDITDVLNNSLNALTNIKILDLVGNPLNCDCSMIYFQTWITGYSHLKKGGFRCSTPENLSGVLLMEAINLTTKCNQGKYYSNNEDYFPNNINSTQLSVAYDYNDQLVSVSMPFGTYRQTHIRCHSIEVFIVDGKTKDENEIYSKILTSCDDDNLNTKFNLSVDPNKLDMTSTNNYRICVSIASITTHESTGLRWPCTRIFSLKGLYYNKEIALGVPTVNSFFSSVPISGIVSLEYNVSQGHFSIRGNCGLWVTIRVKDQTLASKLLNCSDNSYTFRDLEIYPVYQVCYQLRDGSGAYISADLTSNCDHIKDYVRVRTPVQKSVLPLVLTLVFLAVGAAALVVLYLIVKGYLSDSRNPNLFLRSGSRPPLSGIFNCCNYCLGGVRGGYHRRRRRRQRRRGYGRGFSALYLNQEEDEFDQDFDPISDGDIFNQVYNKNKSNHDDFQ